MHKREIDKRIKETMNKPTRRMLRKAIDIAHRGGTNWEYEDQGPLPVSDERSTIAENVDECQ